MKRNMRISIIIASACCACSAGYAQRADTTRNPREIRLALLVRSDNDSVVLRWAPDRPGGWVAANRIGYMVERVAVARDGAFDPKAYKPLLAAPEKPWTLDEWKQRSARDDKYAAIAAQALYGKSFSPHAGTGSIEQMRNAEDELTNRYGFALFAADINPHAAQGLGLRFTDGSARSGETFIYRVFLAGKDTAFTFDTAYAFVRVAAYDSVIAPPNLAASPGDGRITLRWDEPLTPLYTAYEISRSEDGGQTFTLLTKTPYLFVNPAGAKKKGPNRFDDTAVVNYRSYIYRLRGITPFGDLSKTAEVETYGRDLTPPPAPQAKTPVQLSDTKLKLTWDMPAAPPDLAGFVVARSASSLAGYHQLFSTPLPATAREYTDDSASPAEPYYIVASVDTAGNVAPSLPVMGEMIDTTPPAPPTGLAGEIDSNGVVHLHWRLGPEPDIIGYRVLWANSPAHEFSQRTGKPVRDTAFTDSIALNTLTPYIYYRIAAVNSRYNHSAMSPILALRRPSKIPPAAPVFEDVFTTDSAVRLTWAPSPSAGVASHALSRRLAGESAWAVLASLGPKDKFYTDKTVTQNVTYEYTLQAVDSSGLRSDYALPVQARPYDSGLRPRAENIAARYDSATHSVTLSWSYNDIKSEKYFFIIYRSVNRSPLAQYTSVEAAPERFVDTDLFSKGDYEYAVKMHARDGAESRMSARAKVAVR